MAKVKVIETLDMGLFKLIGTCDLPAETLGDRVAEVRFRRDRPFKIEGQELPITLEHFVNPEMVFRLSHVPNAMFPKWIADEGFTHPDCGCEVVVLYSQPGPHFENLPEFSKIKRGRD